MWGLHSWAVYCLLHIPALQPAYFIAPMFSPHISVTLLATFYLLFTGFIAGLVIGLVLVILIPAVLCCLCCACCKGQQQQAMVQPAILYDANGVPIYVETVPLGEPPSYAQTAQSPVFMP